MTDYKVGQCVKVKEDSAFKIKEFRIHNIGIEKQLGGENKEVIDLSAKGVRKAIRVDAYWLDRNTTRCKK